MSRISLVHFAIWLMLSIFRDPYPKHKEIIVDAPLPHPVTPLPPPKHPHYKCNLMDQMWDLLWAGSCRLDDLHETQLAAQEAPGIMAATMLRQQRVMREVSIWESEVEGAMRQIGWWKE